MSWVYRLSSDMYPHMSRRRIHVMGLSSVAPRVFFCHVNFVCHVIAARDARPHSNCCTLVLTSVDFEWSTAALLFVLSRSSCVMFVLLEGPLLEGPLKKAWPGRAFF